jgi:hypothetical protein
MNTEAVSLIHGAWECSGIMPKGKTGLQNIPVEKLLAEDWSRIRLALTWIWCSADPYAEDISQRMRDIRAVALAALEAEESDRVYLHVEQSS